MGSCSTHMRVWHHSLSINVYQLTTTEQSSTKLHQPAYAAGRTAPAQIAAGAELQMQPTAKQLVTNARPAEVCCIHGTHPLN